MPEGARSRYVDGDRVDVVVRPGVRPPISIAATARLAAAALRLADAPRRSSIAVILADDAELAGLNAEHMGHAGPTDVLSFPLLPPSAFRREDGRGQRAAPAGRPFVLPPRARVHLGDVVVSVERAVAQAGAGRGGQTGDVRWSAADELRLLIVHGVLHVCGWDHAEAEEERAMRTLERQLLSA